MQTNEINEASSITIEKGKAVWSFKTPNEGHFYILKTGLIKIQSGITFEDSRLNEYHPGDTFGLVSALTKNPHRSILIAEEESELLKIPIAMLGNYLQMHQDAAIKMMSLYSSQLRALDNHLSKKERAKWEGSQELLFQDAFHYKNLGQKNMAAHAMKRFIEWAKGREEQTDRLDPAWNLLDESNPEYTFPELSAGILNFKTDELVFVENEPGETFYIIKKGTVKISRLAQGDELILALLGEGEIFGEMAVLNRKVRSASATAFEDTTLLKLTRDNFLDNMGEMILKKLFTSFSRRIWYAFQRVELLEVPDPVLKLYVTLQIAISDYNARNKDSEAINEKYTFNFSLKDLKKMIGIPELSESKIRDFLLDPNIVIAGGLIVIGSKSLIDEKVASYRDLIPNKNLNTIFV